jgi:hypothetical protein
MDSGLRPDMIRFAPEVTQWLLRLWAAPDCSPELVTRLHTALFRAVHHAYQQGRDMIYQWHIDQALSELAQSSTASVRQLPPRRRRRHSRCTVRQHSRRHAMP